MTDKIDTGLAASDLPSISVIIPAYNSDVFIEDTLRSCTAQEYDNLEIIIVDDGSTDATFEVVRRFAGQAAGQSIRIERQTNSGPSVARNLALTQAKGEFVLFLDADDLLAEGALQCLGHAARLSGADAVFGRCCNFDDVTKIETIGEPKLKYADAYANIVEDLWFQGSVLFRKTGLPWNKKSVPWEGMEYMLDFITIGHKVSFVDQVVIKVRQHLSPARLTIRLNHFDPAMTGAFFLAQKIKLQKANQLTFDRESALDYKLAGNAHGFIKAGQFDEGRRLLASMNWRQINRYDWFHRGSLVWFARTFGLFLAPRLFFYVARALGRL